MRDWVVLCLSVDTGLSVVVVVESNLMLAGQGLRQSIWTTLCCLLPLSF